MSWTTAGTILTQMVNLVAISIVRQSTTWDAGGGSALCKIALVAMLTFCQIIRKR